MNKRYLTRRHFLSMVSGTAATLVLAACGLEENSNGENEGITCKEPPAPLEPSPVVPVNSAADSEWVGGFAESNPAFAYPEPDLISLDMHGNLDNIQKIQRQMKVIWPEFSWLSDQEDPDSRCFQTFAQDISRVGYDKTGRVWSIICPQQGSCTHNVDCLNLEITVTKQRGWVNEDTGELAVDMGVEGAIWFSPSAHQNPLVKELWEKFEEKCLPFPSDKANAIKITTHKVDSKDPFFPGRIDISDRFEPPEFAIHQEAWTVGNISVQIGSIVKRDHPVVDKFNEEILELFNIAYGNILQEGNILTWNLWFTEPEIVDTQEWAAHAEKWRKSIDADHGAPTGPESEVRLADGSVFEPPKERGKKLEDIIGIVEDLLFSS